MDSGVFSELAAVDLGIGVLKIILLVFILFFALLVHELGHFFAAQIFRVPVNAVSVGRGRTIFTRINKKGTQWKLGAIPFGAHVDLSGMEQNPYWQRALIIAAGPLANFVVPFFLLAGFYLIAGQPSIPPVIVGIEKGFIAEAAGLQPGDRVIAINNIPVHNFRDIWREAYEKSQGKKGEVEAIYKIRRGERVLDIKIKPVWAEYLDDDGIPRSNARYGIIWEHIGFKLSTIIAINGENVQKKPDRARELFIKNFDRPITIEMKGPDLKPYFYKVTPRAAANPDIGNKKKKGYKLIYLGPSRDNFYLHQSVGAQISDALHYTLKGIGKIAAIPFQIFPVDQYAITDENRVSGGQTAIAKITNLAYGIIHNFMVASILIGLVNLLPLPFLDGGYIVMQGVEAARRKPLTRKARALLFVACFLAFYLSALFANIDNLPRYIDSRLKKVHEFMKSESSQNEETKRP